MRIKHRIFGFLIAIFAFSFNFLTAQYVKIGDGSYAGNLGGPFTSSAAKDTQISRFAYIIPKSVLGNMYHLDTITSIEFYHIAGAAPNVYTNLKIWVGNTSRSDFGAGKLHFPTETKNASLVFNACPYSLIGTAEQFYALPFDSKYYVYDSLKGENLTLYVEYQQTKKQSAAIQWYFEGPSTVSAYATNQVKYGNGIIAIDSLAASTAYHATMIFNFPKINQDLAILKVYTLGKIPLPLGKPDSVQALIRNVGKQSLKNFRVYSRSRGYNTQKDSFTVSLLKGQQTFVTVPSLNPLNPGLDTILVECIDKNGSNNISESYRLGNSNLYNYRDVTQSPASGGIGFNGTTGDFVAKFFSNSPKYINQVSVNFGTGGTGFKIGIWSHNTKLNKPSKLVYQSDSLISKSGVYILDFKKPVPVNGTFYVGVRQTGSSNVSFGYQIEDPIRPRTFFYAEPLGDTNWVDFNPDAPFKFLIEPRLQADIDIATISADFPKDSFNIYTTDTLAPKGTIGNVGVQNSKDSFEVHCQIWSGNTRVYNKMIRDTMSAGIKRNYTFPKTYLPKNYGEHILMLYVKKLGDKILDNDTQIRKFYVGVKKDVMINSVYDPPQGNAYIYKTDTLMPLANIQNIGYDNSPNFNVRCRMFQGSKVIYNKTQILSLPKFQSKILNWPTYNCNDTGRIKVVFTTELVGDAYKFNDTQVRTIYIRKLVDIGIDSLRSPDPIIFHTKGKVVGIKFFVYNDGLVPAFSVPFYCSIYDPSGKRVYLDSTKIYLQGLFGLDLQMNKTFTPAQNGLYKLVAKTRHYLDLFNDNDSMVKFFSVGKPYDFQALKVIVPKSKDTISLGKATISPKVLVKNNGYYKNTGPVVCEIYYGLNRIFYDIKNVTLDTGKSDTVIFSSTFRPMNVGNYRLVSYTNLGSDVMRSNDTIKSSFTGVAGKDAFPISIKIQPDSLNFDVKDSIYKISVVANNQGVDSMQKVLIHLAIIAGKDYTYLGNKTLSIRGKSSVSVDFNSNHTFINPGNAKILAYVSSLEDQNIFNDSIWYSVNVTIKQDLGLIALANPNGKGAITQSDSINYPKIRIANFGSSRSTPNNQLVYQLLEMPKGTVYHSDTLSINSIKPTDTLWVQFAKPLKFNQSSAYILKAFALIAKDGKSSNDTITATILVGKNALPNLKNSKILCYPNPADVAVELAGIEVGTIWQLVDINGKLMCEGKANDYKILIPTSTLSSGIYLVKLRHNNLNTQLPILVQHP